MQFFTVLTCSIAKFNCVNSFVKLIKICVWLASTFIADLAITKGKQDVKRVLDRQKNTEEKQILQKFVAKKEELDQDINREIEELKLMSDNCEGDIEIIGM